MNIFDLHAHSYRSDGTYTPSVAVQMAKAAGLSLFALTDHDTVAGVSEALREGEKCGLKVLTGVEYDSEFPCEMHIIGLGLDINDPRIEEAERVSLARRELRNADIVKKLYSAGVDIRSMEKNGTGTTTRLHIALELCKRGYAQNVSDAFNKYLRRGCVGFANSLRPSPKEVIELIRDTGGKSVLAHPCKLSGCDVHAIIRELHGYGLDALEAFYPTSTDGQRELFISLARTLGMYVSCGSDFHGKNRDIALGSAYVLHPELERFYEMLTSLYF